MRRKTVVSEQGGEYLEQAFVWYFTVANQLAQGQEVCLTHWRHRVPTASLLRHARRVVLFLRERQSRHAVTRDLDGVVRGEAVRGGRRQLRGV